MATQALASQIQIWSCYPVTVGASCDLLWGPRCIYHTDAPHPHPCPRWGLLGAFTGPMWEAHLAPLQLDRMPGHILKPREQKAPALGHMSGVYGGGWGQEQGSLDSGGMGWDSSLGTGHLS